MKRVINETFIAMRLLGFRVAGYFLIPFLTTFLALTETWSGTTWDETHWVLIVRMLISFTVAGIGALFAFVDSTFQRAKAEAQQRTDTDQQKIQLE